MKLPGRKKTTYLWATLLCWCCAVLPSAALGGPLRINLSNGTSIEVPYYWEENGEIKFEMPGGVAGIPKTHVTSVQEIVTMREFDPEVMVQSDGDERTKTLAEIVHKETPAPPHLERVSPEQSILLLEKLATTQSHQTGEQIRGPIFSNQGDFTDLVRLKGDGLLLVMQNILSSRDELKNRRFLLSLYDAEGNVLQRQACDVYKLDLDAKTMKKLGIRGHLFAVMATIKPNPRISRYEISAARQ